MCGISLKLPLFGVNGKLIPFCMFLIFPILQVNTIRCLIHKRKSRWDFKRKLLYSPSSTSTTSWCWWRLRLLDNCMSHVFRRCSSCCIAVLCELHSPNTIHSSYNYISSSCVRILKIVIILQVVNLTNQHYPVSSVTVPDCLLGLVQVYWMNQHRRSPTQWQGLGPVRGTEAMSHMVHFPPQCRR